MHNYTIGPTNWDYKEVSVINSLRGDAITRIVYGRTDGRTDRRTDGQTDNRVSHKLDWSRPVELKNKTAIEGFTSHLLTENHVNIYIIQYGENKKIPFLKRIQLYQSNTSNDNVLFVLSVNMMVISLYRKYEVQIHTFSPIRGSEVQTTLSVNLKNTLL